MFFYSHVNVLNMYEYFVLVFCGVAVWLSRQHYWLHQRS